MSASLTVAAGLALAATAAYAATTDLVVHCDPPLAGPMRVIAAAYLARTGVKLRVFPTVPNGIPAQMAREIQNDIVVTQPDIMARMGAAGLLSDRPASARWRNRLVLAGLKGVSRKPIDAASVAAPDPVWGGGPDGPAVLAAAGVRPAKTIGTYDTAEARALVLSGEAAYALLHATELGSELEPIATPALNAERIAMAAMARSPGRPNPDALMRFLATPEAAAILRASGLEAVS